MYRIKRIVIVSARFQKELCLFSFLQTILTEILSVDYESIFNISCTVDDESASAKSVTLRNVRTKFYNPGASEIIK